VREPLDSHRASKTVSITNKRQAVQAERFAPGDPAVVAAKDLVRWELSLGI
jgi:hypothetical protein